MKKKSSKKNRSSVLVLAIIICVIMAFIGAIIYYHVSRAQKAESTASITSSDSVSVSANNSDKLDADKYYRENSQKLLSVIPADKSEKVYSEKDVAKQLYSRGFGKNSEITYDYNIDGSLSKGTQIDTDSDSKHPQYTVTFMCKNGDYWNINVCNNCITAYPVTYNLKHNSGAELIIAETASVTAYDSATNSFYETIPKQSVLTLKQIPAVTAQALERLTAQEIDKL